VRIHSQGAGTAKTALEETTERRRADGRRDDVSATRTAVATAEESTQQPARFAFVSA